MDIILEMLQAAGFEIFEYGVATGDHEMSFFTLWSEEDTLAAETKSLLALLGDIGVNPVPAGTPGVSVQAVHDPSIPSFTITVVGLDDSTLTEEMN